MTFTHRDEDVPVGIEREPRSEVTSPTPGLRNEDVFKVHEPVVHETPPPQRGGRLAAVTDRLGIGQVDKLIGLEIRMRYHVHEPTLALVQNRWDSPDGLHTQDPVSDET